MILAEGFGGLGFRVSGVDNFRRRFPYLCDEIVVFAAAGGVEVAGEVMMVVPERSPKPHSDYEGPYILTVSMLNLNQSTRSAEASTSSRVRPLRRLTRRVLESRRWVRLRAFGVKYVCYHIWYIFYAYTTSDWVGGFRVAPELGLV